jgi:hypothetical protein
MTSQHCPPGHGLRLAAAPLVTLASCGQPRVQEGGADRSPVPMRPVPSGALARCRATRVVDVLCPRAVPETDPPYRSQTIEAPDGSAAAFDLAAGGPYPGFRRRNRPPRFAHVVVEASTRPLAWEFDIRPADLITPPPRRRGEGLCLGRRSWTGTPGRLILAPSYPVGGIRGDHLVFTWTDRGIDVAVSIHAWPDLDVVEATLKAIVRSLAG